MKTMTIGRLLPLFLLPLLLLCLGCRSGPEGDGVLTPRVTTATERAHANQTLTTVESLVLAAVIAGKLKPDDLAKTQAAIAELRQLVKDSETVPMGIADLTLRVANLAATWKAQAKPPA